MGITQRVVLALEKEVPPPGPAIAMISGPSTPKEGAASESPTATETRESPEKSGGVRRKLAWVSGVGAGVVLVAAAGATVLWQMKRKAWENHLGPPQDNPTLDSTAWQPDCGVREPSGGGTDCQNLYNMARRAEMFAVIGYAVGGALAITSGVLFLGGRGRHPDEETRVACGAGPFLRSLSCQLTF